MKTSYVVIVAVALGAALGGGISWAKYHETFPLVAARPTALPSNPDVQGKPKVLVDSPVHDFGLVERDSKAVHVFHITNMGDAPLRLKAGGTTCTNCTIAEVSKTNVPPGETSDVRVEYLTAFAKQQFQQRAEIRTNDPEQPVVELMILGRISNTYRVEPSMLVVSNISSKETKKIEVRVFAYLSDEVALEKYELTGAETASFFEVTSEPIPRDELTDRRAKSGCRLLVTLKPGLPLGPIRQTIRLDLAFSGSPHQATVELPLEGTVDTDISIVGGGWNAEINRLSIGDVQSSKGAKRNLFLIVRGPERHDVTIKVQRVDPEWLQVSLGEPVEIETGTGREGGVTKIPLTIEIPPGTRPVNHLGSDQGKYAEVILETTHPDARQIRMFVQFVVVQ